MKIVIDQTFQESGNDSLIAQGRTRPQFSKRCKVGAADFPLLMFCECLIPLDFLLSLNFFAARFGAPSQVEPPHCWPVGTAFPLVNFCGRLIQ